MEVSVGDGVVDDDIPCDALLRCHGVRVSPSSRLPSVRDSPGGSRTDGVHALVSARYIMALSSWCRMDRPPPRLHERSCVPLASTCLPQGHWYGSQRLVPRPRPTETLIASLSSLNPQVDSGRAWSQSPLWGVDAARSRTLLKLSVKADMTTAWSALSLACSKCSASYYLVNPVCSCCRWWFKFSSAYLGGCLSWADSNSWAAGVPEVCGWMRPMPERQVVPAIPLDESQDLLRLRAGLPGWIHWGVGDGNVSNHAEATSQQVIILFRLLAQSQRLENFKLGFNYY